MSLQFASLNSGSNGNCYYVGNNDSAVLVDAGISCREIEKRLKQLELSINKIKAVFISHEHSDHVKGLAVLTNKHRIPVYITEPTIKRCNFWLENELINTFLHHQAVDIGSLNIIPFSKHHDAADPYSFVIHHNDIHVGVFTDIGTVCENTIHHFKNCNAVFLESNYDVEMLENGNYPYHLKRRIRGGKGHLSNKEALELFINHRSDKLSHLLLSHLSEHNNHPELVYNLFNEVSNGVHVEVASRHGVGSMYEVGTPKKQEPFLSNARENSAQMTLF